VIPTLTIETERGGSYADASEADLHRWVMQIGDATRYLIVHRAEDELFAQAQKTHVGDGFVVEYAVADSDLRQTKVSSLDDVYELLSGWAFDREGWKDGRKWTVLGF